jgi:hypothetical protein
MRFASKQAFLEKVERTHCTLVALIDSVPVSRHHETGVWGDGWTICDLLAHLTEWEQMALTWYREGRNGGDPVRPAPGYKWNQTPALNRAIWKKHCGKAASDVRACFDSSYREMIAQIEQLTDEELLEPGFFAWTGKYPLTTYLGPNTCSHYAFAAKVMNRWLRGRRELPHASR